jgi:hypothetical protein
MMATRALDFAAGKLFFTLQMLLALRAGEFELAHKIPFVEWPDDAAIIRPWQSA